jgi:hypothetical protein
MLWTTLLACSQPAARLPAPAPVESYAPSHLRVDGPLEPLADVQRCAGCHPDQHVAWTKSAHAHASFDNPWYRSSVEALREHGRTESLHCAGCHDPVMLVAGRMGDEIDPAEPDARLGVTCLSCHAVAAVRPDGNASLDLVTRDLVYPDDGDPQTIERHRAQVLPDVLTSGKACGACHRGFLGPATGNRGHLVGMDDQGSWRGSSWAGADGAVLLPSAPQRATCVDCHLQDHQAPGGHTPLAAAVGGLALATERLAGAATVDVGAVWAGGSPLAPELAGEAFEAVDVVVWNTGTGHAFPGGTHDLQDTWLEVEVYAEDGALLASSGTDPSGERARLYALAMDSSGRAVRTHRTREIVTAAFDRTVPPGGAVAVRFQMPPTPVRPDRIEVAMRHRRHPAEMAAAGCEASTQATLDGCAPQPVTTIDQRVVPLGRGEPSLGRAFAHALALSGDVQEHLDDARPSASRAEELASTPLERASARWVLARIEARQGRQAAALAAAEQAEQLIGPHPALWRVRGEAQAQVWAWEDAAVSFEALTAMSPDTAGWRDLARARGSAGDPLGALSAAVEGLALQPRDPDLLRSQALALQDLGDPRAEAAEQAWLEVRPPDDAAELRMRCDVQEPACARDRPPVPVYSLSAP